MTQAATAGPTRVDAIDGEQWTPTEDATLLFMIRDNAIPFDRMWQDAPIWFPHRLNHTPFQGYFVFDENRLLDHRAWLLRGPDLCSMMSVG